ncbi:lipoprotein [Thiosulfatimonas sediminis]|uniref:Lipoprotein n=1 Tax=Thiosulfatimonas sediminis TaxID=2675054 RepID=A0A6F8PV63_9GAMM|nr:M23 family metallopeptidase [Thiosulfatimonas sediminis]BBP45927.1 lipoprotein [Thiosulfatimonas sediminis]
MLNLAPSKPKILIASISLLLLSSQFSGCSSQLKYEPTAQNDGRESTIKAQTTRQGENPCAIIYVVSPGDSLGKIARKCDVPLELLQEANNIKRADLIYINQELRIPYAEPVNSESKEKEVVQQTQETPDNSVAQVFNRDQGQYQSQPIESAKDPSQSSFNWIWPMNKQTDYRFVRDAKGISALEIYGFIGQSVYAMADGVVVFAGDGIADFGNMVMLRHADGKLSVYAHNHKLLVQKGEQVQAGQQIAEMGATGVTQRPKLYVETRYHGQKISIKNILTN